MLAVAGIGSTATASADITGAGSTLVAPLMARWAQDFKGRFNIGVTYGAVGSGAGISQISSRSVDFGASDAPLTAAQASACGGCVQIPWALSATGVAYHINGVRNLKLTGPVIAQIYMGHITNWNDKSIKKLNPHVKLPNLKITPAFRSDGSGDTYAFTDYLSRINSQWRSKVGTATAVSFPAGVGGKGNDGITAVVSSTDGAIGYISASYIIAHGLTAAAIQNKAGRFEFPNLKNIEAAGLTVKKVPASNEMHIVNPPKSATKAYPLSTFTYAIVPHDATQKGDVARFINYAMSTGQQFGAALDFAPLPKPVWHAGIDTLKAL
jgi:phosphate transport system substrate-binding protein